MSENNKTYKTIGDVAKILNLVDRKTGKFSTHTIRYWEKEFKQVKPNIFSGRRRYYDDKTINILKKIQYLLKNKGMTINGVKKFLNQADSELDENDNKTIRENLIKTKITKISNMLKKLKNHG
tara:strand:+ start:290 stop:658 length:369 start_codon:yes stop_codon:yes gene_type:complete